MGLLTMPHAQALRLRRFRRRAWATIGVLMLLQAAQGVLARDPSGAASAQAPDNIELETQP